MSRFTMVVVSVIALFIIEGAIVAAVLVSPDARDGLGRLVQDVSDLWRGTDESEGLLIRFGDKASDVADHWLLPIWQRASVEIGTPTEFPSCSDCHDGYWNKVRSRDLYFNHPRHAELGIDCATCHTDTRHPNPLPPPERVCAECHTEVASESQCQYCHVPGSLPHYYDLAIPRGGYVNCGVCHLPGSFTTASDHHLITTGEFDGSVSAECADCHELDRCQRCHGVDHPDTWVEDHGENVDIGGANNCGTCHTDAYCSDACHAGIRPGSRELPIGGTSG